MEGRAAGRMARPTSDSTATNKREATDLVEVDKQVCEAWTGTNENGARNPGQCLGSDTGVTVIMVRAFMSGRKPSSNAETCSSWTRK